ncbi:hypothetical protein [Pseudomonas moorei]|uniref:hypothetical protein n=1 Tax=Pseudomonas moorei TaxID=395599 RepID=UPI0036F3BA24
MNDFKHTSLLMTEHEQVMDEISRRGLKWRDEEIKQLKAENEALREGLEHARRQPLYSTRRNAARYLHLKSTWGDGLLLERLGGNVLPADWDAEIDKDMSKES